jgi:hypothetical protein
MQMAKRSRKPMGRGLKILCLVAGLIGGFICMVVVGTLVHVPPSGWNVKIAIQVVGLTAFGFVTGWAAVALLGIALGRLRPTARR